ncbi:MAG: hydroxymethylbilane synthase [Syntrophomonadaceae bacterium]|nr:hydroxymethylbilane synthase [Syntrophomonadaceae bacterium]
MTHEIRIGTRESALAMWQTNWVIEFLRKYHPTVQFSVVPIKTKGDKIIDVALAKIGDKGLFTKELEIALLENQIDLAIHSMKDIPTAIPAGLKISAISQRTDPRDVLLSLNSFTLDTLPAGAKVGTSSLRRRAQLLNYRSDLNILDLRGNIDTRMAKLERGEFKAIVLAKAGVERLKMEERISEAISLDVCLPAVGQGAIGIQTRVDDVQTIELVSAIHHPATADAIFAERSLLRELEGGCQIPIGALGQIEGNDLVLDGLVASLNGDRIVRLTASGPRTMPDAIGRELAHKLIAEGAREILQQVRREAQVCEQ